MARNATSRIDGEVLVEWTEHHQDFYGQERHSEFEPPPSEQALIYDREARYKKMEQVKKTCLIKPPLYSRKKTSLREYMDQVEAIIRETRNDELHERRHFWAMKQRRKYMR